MVACVIITVVSVTTAGTWDSDSSSQTLQWPLIPPGEEAGFLPLLLASHCDLLGDVVALEFHQLLELLSFIFPILFLAFRSPSMELCYVSLWYFHLLTYPLGSEPGLTPSQKIYHKVFRLLRSASGLLPGCTL